MTDQQKKVVMVAAVADNGVIGKDGDIPWHISEDLKHFRETTRGNTVVMGRTTYEGIGHPLPYRTNVVVTRDRMWRGEGVFVAPSVEEAIELARGYAWVWLERVSLPSPRSLRGGEAGNR